jgi:thiol:disulfide interchange protein DsbD
VTPIRRILGAALSLSVLLPAPASALESPPAPAPHGTVRLVTPVELATATSDIVVAVLFSLEPGWHVYWVNPGESGEAPRLSWTTPAHFTAAEPDWPAPTRLVIGDIVNFGYEHELLLPVRMHAAEPRGEMPSELKFTLDLTWLACRADECIPAKATLSLSIPTTNDAAVTHRDWNQRIADALAHAPQPASATLLDRGDGNVIVSVSDGDLAARAESQIEFFPRDAGVVDEGDSPRVTFSRDGLEIAIAKAPSAPGELTRLAGVLTLGSGPQRRAYAVEAIANSAPAGATTADLGLTAAFAFAFVGGLLLNLMPCVFPVLSLKVLGFAERAHGDPAKIRAHGWAFTLGVVLSFWLLAGTLLAIRAGGGQLGWGFQLQSPVFVALLAYLLFAMGLSLVGVFEVGTSLSGAVGRVDTEEGLGGSFWTGAIATIVATPCTAPFMGPALGFALTQSAVIAMTVFTALAAGMAAPYLLLSYFPVLLSRLPRPGAWMERLRQLLAFPLFASALWLAAVFAKQAGENALVRLLAGALVLAFALWLWGIAVRSGRSARGSKITALAAAVLALAIGLGTARDPSPSNGAEIEHGSFWQPWSVARVSELRAQGRGVFVNFTAAWCLTCQVNERAIFARTDIRDLFDRYGIAPLEADWTNEDPEIERALASFGRDGVPLYVFFPPRADLAPIVLPQVPTHENLENAFSGNG